MCFLTDGSKLKGKVSSGVYCKEFFLKHIFRLPEHRIVLHAEVTTIKITVDVLRRSATWEVSINSNRTAVILTLSSLTVRSLLFKKCLTSLSIA